MGKNNKSKSHRKFCQTWCTQTQLGQKYGLTAIEVGKILISYGLKDPTTGYATQEAIDDGYAKSTPLNDGTPFYMWSRSKLAKLFSGSYGDPVAT